MLPSANIIQNETWIRLYLHIVEVLCCLIYLKVHYFTGVWINIPWTRYGQGQHQDVPALTELFEILHEMLMNINSYMFWLWGPWAVGESTFINRRCFCEDSSKKPSRIEDCESVIGDILGPLCGVCALYKEQPWS